MSNGNDPFGNGGDDGGDWGQPQQPGEQPDPNRPSQPGPPQPGQPGQPPTPGPGQPQGGPAQPPQGGPAQPPQGGPGQPGAGGQQGFGAGPGGPGDFGAGPGSQQPDEDIDMNYGQPLSQPPTQSPGTQMQKTKGKMENEDIIAMVLTFFIPGVGHMMLGQTTKGIVILAGTFLTCGAGYLLTILFAVDAYLVAMTRKYRTVDDWEFFPDMNEHF